MDDDNYVNVRMLVKLLSSYLHTQDIYIGKPSLDRPIQATERISENKMVRVGRVWIGLIWAWGEGAVVSLCWFPSLAASCAFLVCHGWSRVLYQPGAGTEDEPLGQVRALLSHGDSSWSPGHREVTFLGMRLDPVPQPFSLCLSGDVYRELGNKLGRASVPPN